MIKEFQIDDTVSFKGSVDFSPLDKTVVAWVDNRTYQAIVEHPDGHTGDEIPGKGLNSKKTYAFIKTDHLDHYKGEDDTSSEDQPVKDVAAEKVEEVKEAPKQETTGEGPGNETPEKPVVVVSEQLILFKENVSEQNHELIDILLKVAHAFETGQALQLELNNPKDLEEKIKKAKDKSAIPTDTGKDAPEDTRSAAEKIAAHEAEAKEIEAQEQRLKSQAEHREKIHNLVVNGLMKKVLQIKEGPVVKNGQKTTAYVCFLDEEGLVPLDHKDDIESIVNYFQNVPADFADFAGAMAAAGALTEESGTESDKSETITYKKGEKSQNKDEGAAAAEEKPAEKESADDLEEKYHSKLTGLSGIGPVKANMIMKTYGTPEDLIEAYKSKELDKMEGVSAGIIKALKTACKGDYFLN